MSVLQSAIAAASGSAGPAAYQIERSLRFNSADSAYLSWTPAQVGNRQIFTYSAWFKPSSLSGFLTLFSAGTGLGTDPYVDLRLGYTSGDMTINCDFGPDASRSQNYTTAVHRDPAAYYHIVIAVDTTQSTATNRVKIYVNNNQLSYTSTATLTQNRLTAVNNTNAHNIGRRVTGSDSFLNGLLTEVNFIDGQALTPSDFGETNTTTGVWFPKAYTGSYGKNGFYLPFNDNSTVLNLGRNRQTLTADPYFPVTTLLLNGNGTNGAQNNTFLDSSSNNFTITRNGNTTQGTFSPFQPGWSGNFTGAQTSPSLSFPSNAAYTLGSTSDFTVEGWVYFTGGMGSEQSIVERFDGTAGPGWIFGKSSGDKIWFGFGGTTYPGNTSVVANRWYHICWMRTGGNSYLFLDGVLDRTAVTTANFTDGTSPLSIGERDSASQTFPFSGYLSNLRIVKGTAVYSTTGFTVPTAPLTAITNTTLLTLQSNRFVDNSTTAAVATVGSASSIQAFSPFAPTAAYSAATNGGSGYFDGTGDYLSVGNSTAFDFGSGDFTVEFLWYPTTIASNQNIMAKWWTGGSQWVVQWRSAGYFRFAVNSTTTLDFSGAPQVNAWNHVAFVRIGTSLYCYLNGVRNANVATIPTLTATTDPFTVGQFSNASTENLSGYLSSVRITKGGGIYTTTPIASPSSPFTTTVPSGTVSVLLNFTNAGILDATGKNDLETVGNAQISTTQSKWGGSSMYFDGSGDYLQLQSSALFGYGTGDFTIEFWGYFTSISASTPNLVDQRNGSATAVAPTLYLNNGTLTYYVNGSNRIVGNSLSANTWYHIALCRSGTSTKLFVDGIQVGSTYADSNNYVTSPIRIFANNDGGSLTAQAGYVDDLRISKFARYTGNFTVPQAQFAYNQADINVKQWVPNNFSVTAGTGNDSLVDSPTNYGTDTGAGGEVRGNYCTWNTLKNQATLSDGNLSATNSSTTQWYGTTGTIGLQSGKWYWECTPTTSATAMIGLATASYSTGGHPGWDANSWAYYSASGQKFTNNAGSAYGASYTTNDVIGVAFDADAGTLTFYRNGVSQGTAYTGLTNGPYFPAVGVVNSQNIYLNAGQRPFAYTAPSGFKALCTTNLPTPAIGASSTALASQQMNIALWTGNGSTQNITGLGFSPDLVWYKDRSAASSNALFDRIRGVDKWLTSNGTDAEATVSGVSAFNADGFSLGSNAGGNFSGRSYVGWTWKGGGAAVSNTAGSITSQVSANAAAGISVVTWTSNAAAAMETIGHGLGVTPALVICKNRDYADWWLTWHKSFSNTVRNYLQLNTTGAVATASADYWGHTSTTLGIRQSALATANTQKCVAYCFAEVPGFSKFGSYTGNGSDDGPFVYCGFRPRFIMIKNASGVANWTIVDTSRDTYNVSNKRLFPSTSDAENTAANNCDILSNGFKIRIGSDTGANTSGSTYIFAAFSESPFNYSRAR